MLGRHVMLKLERMRIHSSKYNLINRTTLKTALWGSGGLTGQSIFDDENWENPILKA